MIFKVDYSKLYETGESVEKENKQLNETLNALLKIIDDLGSCWTGLDYENFKNASETYIKNLNKTTKDIEYIGSFMKEAASVYCDNDIEWDKQIKGVDEM